MPKLCFVTTCMGRLTHLQQTLPRLVAGQGDSSCVVVDFSCPERCGDWVAAHFPQVRVVRVEGQKVFNRSIASNAGARVADASWICFIDADILVESGFSDTVLPLLKSQHYYRFWPITDWATCGTFICTRKDFDRVGGYDEIYQGWGEQDLDLYEALEFAGVSAKPLPNTLLQHMAHDDGQRVQFQELPDHTLSWSINLTYRTIKFDVMRIMRASLTQSYREAMYAGIVQAMNRSVLDKRAATIRIEIDGSLLKNIFPANARLERSLTYSLFAPS